jgi:hypothetical protein
MLGRRDISPGDATAVLTSVDSDNVAIVVHEAR